MLLYSKGVIELNYKHHIVATIMRIIVRNKVNGENNTTREFLVERENSHTPRKRERTHIHTTIPSLNRDRGNGCTHNITLPEQHVQSYNSNSPP